MIVNRTRDTIIARNPRLARGFGERLKGLMGRSAVDPEEALVFARTNAVHTCFMRFPLEVIFCSTEGRVLKVLTLPPWRMSPVVLHGYWVIERSPDHPHRVVPGDCLVGLHYFQPDR